MKQTSSKQSKASSAFPPCSNSKLGKPVNVSWHDRFLVVLHQDGRVREACRVVGVSRETAYQHKERFPVFGKAWDDALEEAIDTAEQELYQRAVKGVEKPIYQQGRRVGTMIHHSDILLMFLLRARRPQIYGNKGEVTASSLSLMPDDEALALAQKREKSIIATMKAAAGLSHS